MLVKTLLAGRQPSVLPHMTVWCPATVLSSTHYRSWQLDRKLGLFQHHSFIYTVGQIIFTAKSHFENEVLSDLDALTGAVKND